MENEHKKLTLTTLRAMDYRIMPAEGALGGITPSQMFQINFYTETPNIPIEVTHELNEDGKLGPQIEQRMEGGDILRELQCGVLMTVEQAEALAKWILNTVEQHKESESPASGYIM